MVTKAVVVAIVGAFSALVALPPTAVVQPATIYFDRSHGGSEFLGTRDARYAALAQRLGARAIFGQHALSEATLTEVSVAVLTFIPPFQQPLTDVDLTVLRKFVAHGGSLLVVADEDKAARVKLEAMRFNELLTPYGLHLTDDTPVLANRGAVAPRGTIISSTREIPYSGGRAVEGGTPVAFALDEAGRATTLAHSAFVTTPSGGKVMAMGEGMASLFLGSDTGERLVDERWWGKDSELFMEDILSWLLGQRVVAPHANVAALTSGGTGWVVHNLTSRSVTRNGRVAVELSVQSRGAADRVGTGGVAYLDAPAMAAGTVEFTAWGEPGGGCGIAFAGEDLRIHEAVYFRPYAFSATPPGASTKAWVEGRDDAVQYVAHPEFGWHKLRSDVSTRALYEKRVDGPHPKRWFRARVRFDAQQVEVWVEDQRKPCLSVRRLAPGRAGKVGLWVGDGAPAVFDSLLVSPGKR